MVVSAPWRPRPSGAGSFWVSLSSVGPPTCGHAAQAQPRAVEVAIVDPADGEDLLAVRHAGEQEATLDLRARVLAHVHGRW